MKILCKLLIIGYIGTTSMLADADSETERLRKIIASQETKIASQDTKITNLDTIIKALTTKLNGLENLIKNKVNKSDLIGFRLISANPSKCVYATHSCDGPARFRFKIDPGYGMDP